MNRQAWMNAVVLAGAMAGTAAAYADPVVYTLRTVADGRLGSRTFYEALVTIRLVSTTGSVQSQAGPNGGTLYTNHGTATVTVDDGYRATVATFAKGEIYVFYDTYGGVAGFGSPISPTYPVALGCANEVAALRTQDCLQGDWTTVSLGNSSQQGMYNGTASALADAANIPGDVLYMSDDAANLPANLYQSTLLTGRAHTCATAYTTESGSFPAYLVSCPSAAPRGLRTDRGGFYLQDQFGIYDGTEANTGALQVEVFQQP